MLDAISGGSTIAVTVSELFGIAFGAGTLIAAVVGVYQAGRSRDDKAKVRLDDLERWITDEWKGGQKERDGYKQKVDSLVQEQTEKRGAAKERDRERRRRDSDVHAPVRGHPVEPGHDTLS